MIKFGDINIEGFGSIIKPTKFKLDRKHLNIIRGKVGAGKTSIPSALVWCLYGYTLKGKASVNTWKELQYEGYKGTKVELQFDNYTVIRCSGYKGKVFKVKGGNNLFIVKDGELLHTERNKIDKQRLIKELIGYSHSLFINSIVFGQRMKKIIEESGPAKKKIFEEAFEVTFIEEAKNKIKVDNDKDISLLSKYNMKYGDKEDKLKELKKDYKDQKSNEKRFEEHKKGRVNRLKKQLEEFKVNKTNIQNNIKNLKTYDAVELITTKKKLGKSLVRANKTKVKYDKLLAELVVIEDEETILNKEPNSDIGVCDKCGSKLSFKKSKQLSKQRKNRLKELGLKADDLRKKQFSFTLVDIKKLKKDIETNKANISEAQNIDKLNSLHQGQLTISQRNIDNIKDEIRKAKSEKLIVKSISYKKRINKVNKQMQTILPKLESLRDTIGINNWLIKDPLSNTGLKAYIFNSLLSKVNKFLNDYSTILGFNVEFGIDIESTRKDFYQVITRNDIIINYDDLSGGQKQLVDTSVALAIHSVIATIRPTNIMFMDEPFEGLDDEAIETVAELIEFKTKKQCLYLITHHSSFNPTGANEILVKLSPEGHTVVL